MDTHPTRDECVAAAGAAFAAARARRDTLPVAEAARRALRPGGPSLAELEARISARRAPQAVAA